MKSKYNMTVEQNIAVAKRNIVDYLYKSANLEGIAVTFPETDDIFNNKNVAHLSINEIVTINNLKRAWDFTLDHTSYPTDYPFICKTHSIIGSNLIHNAGLIRNMNVNIGGTEWKPDIPDESQVKCEIAEIMDTEDPTDRAVTLMLYSMRKQIFFDGNKRTAMLVGNHVMVSNGAGIISVPIKEQNQFRDMLIEYYETNNMVEIKNFVCEKCIDGIDFPQKKPEPAFNGTEPWNLPNNTGTRYDSDSETMADLLAKQKSNQCHVLDSSGPDVPGE
jgi:hypothetical protein